MTPEAWVIFKAILWMVGVPMLVWYVKALQVERLRTKHDEKLHDCWKTNTALLRRSIHYEEKLRMIASRALDPAKIAFDALTYEEKRERQ